MRDGTGNSTGGSTIFGHHEMATARHDLLGRGGDMERLSESGVMSLCDHDPGGMSQALVCSREVRARFRLLPDPPKLGTVLRGRSVVHRNRYARILVLDGQGRGNLAILEVLGRKNREFRLRRHHAYCAAEFALSVHGVAVRHPNIAAAATLNDSDTCTSAALVFVGELVCTVGAGGRWTPEDLGRQITADIEESSRDRQWRSEDDVKSQDRRRHGH